MRKLVLVFVIGLFMSAGAWAQDFRKGLKAYEKDDYETALQEWLPLAKEGDARAQSWTGSLYSDGLGVIQNYREAFKWFKLSAEQGYKPSQLSLGRLYLEGEGVSQDIVRSHMWYNIAASTGVYGAARIRDTIADHMTPAQIDEAQQLAEECVAKNYKGC